MKKLWVIGTGRNGSKLTATVLRTATSSVVGEIHHGLKPIFFKNAYLGNIGNVSYTFKRSRDKAINEFKDIYIEKNHLVVPILDDVIKAYPDALFLYISRNPKDIVRSYSSRNVYTGEVNVYEEGRLTPHHSDKYYSKWNSMNKFSKSCWYVCTMMKMCDDFLKKLDSKSYRVLPFEDFTTDSSAFEPIFDWFGLDFNIDKVNTVLGTQIGSSARSVDELTFKVDKAKVKNTKHWKDWSDEKREIYNRFFE